MVWGFVSCCCIWVSVMDWCGFGCSVSDVGYMRCGWLFIRICVILCGFVW